MSGFCGWFGREQVDGAHTVLERMAAALPQYGRIQAANKCGDGFGLALKADPAMASIAQEPDLIVAIEGFPEWSSAWLRKIAGSGGHARALMAAYRHAAMGLFSELRGTFSFALIDLSARRAFCAIDRFGVQTLCYAQPNDELVVFGSTSDAVRAHPKVRSTVPLQSIFDYLYFVDRIPAPRTIYREQRKLAPAEYLLMEQGSISVMRYWEMPYRSDERVDVYAAAAELKQRLHAAVEANLVGEDGSRVGAFLSGGLDSSSIVGVASALLPGKLQTFTIGFPVAGFDEAEYAGIAAKRYGTNHHTYYIRPEDVLDALLKSIQIYDEPFANSSIIPAYHCARVAKEAGVEMMLAGDGGDELFAGNKRYVDDSIFDYYVQLPSLVRRGIVEPLLRPLALAKDVNPARKVLRYVQKANKPVPERLTDNLFQALHPSAVLTVEALREIDLDAPRTLAAEIYDMPRDASKVQRMMHLDLRLTLADSDLRKVVRMCELAGVRTRFPFLHDELAEFSARLPETLLIEGGELRRFYKRAMGDFLPKEIIAKKKHGFGLPYVTFMNTYMPMRELICDSLAKLKKRAYFQPAFLDGLIDRARAGILSGHEIVAWDLLVLELWLDSRT